MKKDQLNRQVLIDYTPVRIVSCVPSTTELLYDLGLDEEVAGITKFCVHPEKWRQKKMRIGGTKSLHLDRIAALNPDLVLCDKEENDRSQVEHLMERFTVWVSNVNSMEEGPELIRLIGAVVSRESPAAALVRSVKLGFDRLEAGIAVSKKRHNTAYIIWREPLMAAGCGTYIDDLMRHCGMVNVLVNTKSRYPELTMEQLREACPDLILLSSEPYPFSNKHLPEFQRLLPDAKVVLVDGEMFSWPGSRMLPAAKYLLELVKSF